MLTFDLSKAVPRGAFTYISALIPGLFFEISVLFGNPELVTRLISRPQQAFVLSHYLQLAIALFLAFVIGNAFLIFVALIQLLLGYLYRFWSLLREEFCKWPLFPVLNWLLKKPFWASRRRVIHFHRWVIEQAFPSSTELAKAQKCWRLLARKLLKARYGIEIDQLGEEWSAVYWTIGTPTPDDVRGSILVMASHATGWCGLAAIQLAPALYNRYYLAYCLLMVGIGLHNDFHVAIRRNEPEAIAYTNIRALLREYRRKPRDTERQPRAKPGV